MSSPKVGKYSRSSTLVNSLLGFGRVGGLPWGLNSGPLTCQEGT
jgi:hypothetical protein